MRDIYHEEKPMGHGLTLINTSKERFYHEGHEEHEVKKRLKKIATTKGTKDKKSWIDCRL